MASTASGWQYAVPNDTLVAWPAVSQAVADKLEISLPKSAGMQLVKTQTIGAGVSSVNVTGAFSATYDNYKIVLAGGVAANNGVALALQIGNATANYYGALNVVIYGTGGVSTATDNNGNRFTYVGYGTNSINDMNVDVNAPFLTKNTMVRALYVSSVAGGSGGYYCGFLNNSTSYTDFTIVSTGGTITGGTIAVYGYSKV